MSEFIRVANVNDLADPGKQTLEVDDRIIVLFRVDGHIFAIDDLCTHDDGPLGEGQLCGHEIACPRHGAKFDIRTGQALTMPATRATAAHEVKVVGQDVFVRIGSPPNPEAAKVSGASTVPTSPKPAAPDTHQSIPVESAPSQGSPEHYQLPVASAPIAPSTAPVETSVPADSLSEDTVREALKQVIDPELFVNIVDLGLIYLVSVTEKPDGKNDVAIEMTMTSPACPAGPQLLQNSKDVLQRISGVDQVEVKLVMTPPWTPDRMTDDARDQLGIF